MLPPDPLGHRLEILIRRNELDEVEEILDNLPWNVTIYYATELLPYTPNFDMLMLLATYLESPILVAPYIVRLNNVSDMDVFMQTMDISLQEILLYLMHSVEFEQLLDFYPVCNIDYMSIKRELDNAIIKLKEADSEVTGIQNRRILKILLKNLDAFKRLFFTFDC